MQGQFVILSTMKRNSMTRILAASPAMPIARTETAVISPVFAVALTLACALLAAACVMPSHAQAAPGIQSESAQPTTSNNNSSRLDTEEARQILESASPEDKAALKNLMKQLDDIDAETEIASENYNEARARLDRIRKSIAQAKHDYAVVNKAYKIQVKRLNERAVTIYRQGDDTLWALLFESKSLNELVANVQYLVRISTNDARLLGEIADRRTELETTLAQLKEDEKEAKSLEFELKARKIEVAQRNEDRTATLKNHNQSLLALLDATTASEAAAEVNLANQIELGQLKDVVVTPGSPVETALAYRGIPYVWGGASKRGFDCSGLLVFVFAQHGITLPHYSGSQYRMGTPVTDQLAPGDAVFFGSPVHHVGIYMGGGYFVHAPHTGDVVKISKLSTMSDYVGARRYNWETRTGAIR